MFTAGYGIDLMCTCIILHFCTLVGNEGTRVPVYSSAFVFQEWWKKWSEDENQVCHITHFMEYFVTCSRVFAACNFEF